MRSRAGRLAAPFVVLAATFALPVSTAGAETPCAYADARPADASTEQLSAATLCLMNAERSARRLEPLTASPALGAGAASYAAKLVAERFFSHSDRSGGNVASRVRASNWDQLGENLGWGSLHLATPQALVQGWMASPAHRDNVLHPAFDSVGVGIALGAPVEGAGEALTAAVVFGDGVEPRVARRAAKAKRKCGSLRRASRACKRSARARARVRAKARARLRVRAAVPRRA